MSAAKHSLFGKRLTKTKPAFIIKTAKAVALEHGFAWRESWEFLLAALRKNPKQAPKAPERLKGASLEKLLLWWIRKYESGYKGRPSTKRGGKSTTIPDPLIEIMLKTALKDGQRHRAEKLLQGHRMAMRAENLLGRLLEEYLHLKTKQRGWYVCWGSTIKSVDLVSKSGALWQIKNRSNSENSSSKTPRSGTKIKLWYRIRHESGATKDSWRELRAKTNTPALSETDFRAFAKRVIRNNPSLLNPDHLR